MNRLIRTIVMLAWGLWFGGLVILFVAVKSLFETFDDRRELAGEAATAIFHRFNRVQLVLAALTLLATFAWWAGKRSRAKLASFVFFALAALMAVYLTAILTPKIDALRLAGKTHTTEFRTLHGVSMTLYLAETTMTLCAGVAFASDGTSMSRPNP